MDQAFSFPDPMLAVVDLLRAVLAGRSEPFAAGARVSVKAALPDGSRTLPWVQVRSDGSYRDARLNGRATVRVLVFHQDESKAQDLAALCEGLLLAGNSDKVRGASPLAGPLPTGDGETGEPLSFFTITVRLRPTHIN